MTDRHRAYVAAATKFDWVMLESTMEASCRCGWTEHEMWGARGSDDDGSRPVYDPTRNPCPACVEAVKPFVDAALDSLEVSA